MVYTDADRHGVEEGSKTLGSHSRLELKFEPKTNDMDIKMYLGTGNEVYKHASTKYSKITVVFGCMKHF